MVTETIGMGIVQARQSFDAPIDSLKEEFEIAVLDIFGSSAYFDLIKGSVLKSLSAEILSMSGPTPIKHEKLEVATASKGFKNLNNALAQKGFTATLEADPREIMPSPYLTMCLNKN